MIGTERLDFTENILIRSGETARTFLDNEQARHYNTIEESGKHLAEQSLWDRRVNCVLITQIATPTILRKKIERPARIGRLLPVNAYVRNIKMPKDIEDTDVNNNPWGKWTWWCLHCEDTVYD